VPCFQSSQPGVAEAAFSAPAPWVRPPLEAQDTDARVLAEARSSAQSPDAPAATSSSGVSAPGLEAGKVGLQEDREAVSPSRTSGAAAG